MKKCDLEHGRFPLFMIGTISDFSQLLGWSDVKYVNGCVGWDGRLHLLFQDFSEPSHRAFVVVMTMDWHHGSIYTRDVVYIDELPSLVTHIETYGKHYLLIDGDFERYDHERPRSFIVSQDGVVVSTLELDTDIQQCIVRRSNDIAIGYGDIFWSSPGVVIFNKNGHIKWKNTKYDIVHSYAMHDSGDRLWFYFYTEFKLASTKLSCTSAKQTTLKGCDGFLIHPDGKHAVFSTPWYDAHSWHWVHRIKNKWKTLKRGVPTCNDQPLKIKRINFERSNFFCLDENGVFYGNTIEEPPYKLLWFKKRGKRITTRFYPTKKLSNGP